jgi:hypothetical protein
MDNIPTHPTNPLFRPLNAEQEAEFRAYARNNYKKLEPIEGTWHPVIQHECALMNAEA